MNQFDYLIGEAEPNKEAESMKAVNDLAKHPGIVISVDPELAEHMGAFVEDAMSENAAFESRFDATATTDDKAV